MALQLDLLVDRSVVTEVAIILGKEDLYATLLGKVPKSLMVVEYLLAKIFKKLHFHTVGVFKEQYAQTFIL
ncbi:hypothetical protein J1N35_021327 [Gossypium stocksii]|uniref:Uncharacterized protein n=1 Tax=Gossypium stocksii TaxID=47602 RepID=A0A9D3VEB0_9ROSI|nr:hypothetical protein J1N35_021327 [Gossypium stocksii]